MQCAMCKDEIKGRAIKQGDKYYCSLECANQALGLKPEEEDYYDENDLEGLYDEDEE